MEGEDPDPMTGSDDAEDEEEETAIGDFSQYPRLHPSRTRSNTLLTLQVFIVGGRGATS